MKNVASRLSCMVLFLGALSLLSCGTGGELSSGPSPVPPQPLPPTPDFSLSINDPTLPLQAQGGPTGQVIGVTALAGFTGVVTISFPNLPAGFTRLPSASQPGWSVDKYSPDAGTH